MEGVDFLVGKLLEKDGHVGFAEDMFCSFSVLARVKNLFVCLNWMDTAPG